MNILVATDKNYLMPLTVMLNSLLINNKNNKFDVYVLHNTLSDEQFINLKNELSKTGNIHIKPIKIDLKDILLPVSGHITEAAYYRVFAYEYLPISVDRILWLDCDLIINKSIENLYNLNFEDNYLVACEDIYISKRFKNVYNNIGLSSEDKYFNSGVVLFNLEKIRAFLNYKEEVINFLAMHKDNLIFHDQDILNGIFVGKVRFLDPKIYNRFVTFIIHRYEEEEALENCAIFHYANKTKPWQYNYWGPLDEFWWNYAKRTKYQNKYNDYKKKHRIYCLIPYRKINLVKKVLRVFKHKVKSKS